MNTSLQAAGRLTAEFANRSYPWRVVIMAETESNRDGWVALEWSIYQVYEERSEAEALRSGEITALELLDEPGVTNAHYYVGEVA
jgi:hypothetical protein